MYATPMRIEPRITQFLIEYSASKLRLKRKVSAILLIFTSLFSGQMIHEAYYSLAHAGSLYGKTDMCLLWESNPLFFNLHSKALPLSYLFTRGISIIPLINFNNNQKSKPCQCNLKYRILSSFMSGCI